MSEPTRKSQIEARFGASAEAYARSLGHRAGYDLDRLLELAAPSGTQILLDVATGAGNTALAFAPHVARVVALDLAEGMIEVTRSRFDEAGYTNGEFVVHDAEELPFADETFDLVTCRIAPHHFLDVDGATREVARVLKSGGRYLLVDSKAPDDPDVAAFLHDVEVARDPTHVRSLSRAEWTAVLEGAGLRVEHSEVVGKRHDFEDWLARGVASGPVRRAVRERMRRAPEAAREALEIALDGDRVAAFSDEKVLFVALR